ncbi:MAG: AbrB/MazE/SpoVT family DNA-binding domain-containing protein [Candidatus Aenigmarchaeota archaeon]|nr:AbrB/MazE/SpoVT family DNA-binding domain-containing protein [Candidatus Aenigmarchaeota archaeon]
MKESIRCECGGTMKRTRIEIMPDLFSEGYKCAKCGETEFTEEQMRKALRVKEKAIKIMVTRRLGMVGESVILRIPKEVTERMNLKEGEEVRVIVENNKMIVELIE